MIAVLDACVLYPTVLRQILLGCAERGLYTPIWSAELYVQARDRIHRKGQTNRCTYYHMVAGDTIERGVLWACRNKRSKSEAIMQALSGQGVAA